MKAEEPLGQSAGHDAADLEIVLRLSGFRTDIDRPLWARAGVPLPRGAVFDAAELALVDLQGRLVPWQARSLAHWPDRSLKWLLVDILDESSNADGHVLRLVRSRGITTESVRHAARVAVSVGADELSVRSGDLEYRVRRGATTLLSVDMAGRPCLDASGVQLRLRGEDGTDYLAHVNRIDVESAGPVRADLVLEGGFVGSGNCPLNFRLRWTLLAQPGQVFCDLLVRNPRAARHVGGLWDLGDEGSWQIRDLSLHIAPGFNATHLDWAPEPHADARREDTVPRIIYQDSSGGERWNSANHLDRGGTLGVGFRGYQVRVDGAIEAEGLRAQPWLSLSGADCSVSLSVTDFWQNFPKALRWDGTTLSAGLFPSERQGPTELQGGEQKRHLIMLAVQGGTRPMPAEGFVQRAHAAVDPAAVERSGAVSGLSVSIRSPQVTDWIEGIIAGEESFEARREIIDEYGWRHFGDLYADHEAVHSDPAIPFISHYNNQYDFVLGAGIHALRTGDARWSKLMDEAARHVVDIDIYHTKEDKAAFNGGLFWHTDHYVPAATATHRTYSRANAGSGDYGGGPSNEHNYASGLLLHHYMTGDAESREAVVGLADWVCAMDDGTQTLSALVDEGATGLASKTLDFDYHGPGRGAGNSISTLLDAYRASRRRAYLSKAEALIERCIHPEDDIAARQLDDPERRWSYLVFLQVLGKYLDLKLEYSETDYAFQYARHSLLHYAAWMLEHEAPYRDVAHKLEIPSETWSAHDARKCHIFHLASLHDDDLQRAEAFRDKAGYFQQRWIADLSSFPTQCLTRPMVLVAVYGHLHDYFSARALQTDRQGGAWQHNHDFGRPVAFVPQRLGIKSTLRGKLKVAVRESKRLVQERLGRLSRRVKGSR